MMKAVTKTISFLLLISIITPNNANAITEGPHSPQRVEGDPDLESYLREAIENFREQMKNGIESIKMPVLDPLVLKHLDINVREDAATLDLKIHEMNIRGLSNFTLPVLQANLDELYMSLTMSIPVLIVEGRYNLSSMIYKIFPIYGHGPFLLLVTDITVSGTGQLQFVETDLAQVTSLTLDLMWGNMTMNLGDFLGGGRLQKVLERAIPGFGRDLFLGFKPIILQRLNEAAIRKINQELSDPKIREIIAGILQGDEEDYVF